MTTCRRSDVSPYDALLLVSFGGPERPEDVVPFLENVTRGRGVPRDRLEEVGQHYFLLGGKSPINDLNRTLLEAIRADLAAHDVDLPVYWGNRNWDPYLADTVCRMRKDGVTRAACFVTSAYSSYSSCRQYREDLAAAAVHGGPRLDRLRSYYNHPGFLEPTVDAVIAAIADRPAARLVFVTHSIPTSMNDGSGPRGGAYLAQHRNAAAYVAERVARVIGREPGHDLVFCSRSGPPQMPWLEPDVNDHLERLAGDGVGSVVLIPIGFVSDHMEVVYDLDTEALATAARLGLDAVRVPRRVPTRASWPWSASWWSNALPSSAATGSTASPSAVSRRAGTSAPRGCCPNPRGEKPALGGAA